MVQAVTENQEFLTLLFDYGMSGLFIAFLIVMIWKMWDSHKKERKEWMEISNKAFERLDTLHSKAIDEHVKTREVLTELATLLKARN